MSVIENRIPGYLYNELYSESSEETRTYKMWFGPLLFIKILLKTAQLLSKHFSSGLFFSLYPLFPFS